ncbi:MAG TPA: hypothetical protein VH502_13830, partial [Actinoplanes sp.]
SNGEAARQPALSTIAARAGAAGRRARRPKARAQRRAGTVAPRQRRLEQGTLSVRQTVLAVDGHIIISAPKTERAAVDDAARHLFG